MTKINFFVALLLVVGIMFSASASFVAAQTMTPVYNQSGMVVSAGSYTGWYYSSAGIPIFYYTNGRYYSPVTNRWYLNSALTLPVVLTPGVPNTGAGGDALATWLLLGASGLVATGGVVYLARSKRREELST